MKLILKLIASSVAVLIAAYIIPGVSVESFTTAVIVAVVLGLLNTVIKPILVILTLPITILTLGLFYLIINALMVIITASLVPGFHVDTVTSALFFGIAVSIVNSFLYSLLK